MNVGLYTLLFHQLNSHELYINMGALNMTQWAFQGYAVWYIVQCIINAAAFYEIYGWCSEMVHRQERNNTLWDKKSVASFTNGEYIEQVNTETGDFGF